MLPALPGEQDKLCDAEQCQERLSLVMITELQLKDDSRKKYLTSLVRKSITVGGPIRFVPVLGKRTR